MQAMQSPHRSAARLALRRSRRAQIDRDMDGLGRQRRLRSRFREHALQLRDMNRQLSIRGSRDSGTVQLHQALVLVVALLKASHARQCLTPN
jgi:hypothetical protein